MTHVLWSILLVDFENSVVCIIGGHCQLNLPEVRSLSGQKRSNLKMKFFNKKGAYQMQFELRNTMVPFILLYNVKNVLKNEFEKHKNCKNIDNNANNLAIFEDIGLKRANVVHQCVFYHIYSGFCKK